MKTENKLFSILITNVESYKKQITVIQIEIKYNIAPDKLAHFLAFAAGSFVLAILLPLWLVLATALIIGVLKEVYDIFKKNPTGFGWWDLVADLCGVLVGIGLYELLKFVI